MAPSIYAEILVKNIGAARKRADLDQADVVERMRDLGFKTWHRQTMGKVERGERRVSAEEVLGLAACLGTTVQHLMSPLPQDGPVELSAGERALSVGQVRSLVFGQGPNDEEFRGSAVRGARDVRGLSWSGNALELDSGER
jgi:transcriptional regulator with XRE-family HTH domain